MNPIRVGNAPCSWGTLEFEGLAGEPLSPTRFLDELAETGYTGTELGDWGFLPTDPEVLHGELARRDLTLLGAFVPVAFRDAAAHGPGEERVLRVARLLAAVHQRAGGDTAPFVVLADENGTDPRRTQHAGRIGSGMGLSEEEWGVYADGVERVAKVVRRETGLRSVFHHHCGGYVETPEEVGMLLSRTDPGLVGLLFDTGHMTLGAGEGGVEAAREAWERFAERTWYVHFKDCQPDLARQGRQEGWDYFTAVRRGVFCELGQGSVDFAGVLADLRRRGYGGWVLVEQDVLPGLGTPKESARRNREYLRSLGV